MPIYQIRLTVPMSEIRLWLAYYETRFDRHDKMDYYLAQIAAYMVKMHSAKEVHPKIKDYLIKFQTGKKLTKEQITKRAKQWAFALVGHPDKKKANQIKRKTKRK